MIAFEKEIIQHLSLPSIPKKQWDGKSSFKYGVAVTCLGSNIEAYAVCTFDADKDKMPRVIKSFASEQFYGISHIYPVPSFMDVDVASMDLDEASREAAERLAQEAKELVAEESGEDNETEREMNALPEWVFDNIHNIEEAQAFVQSWNAKNKIKGRVPQNEETLKLRLLTIYNTMKEKNK